LCPGYGVDTRAGDFEETFGAAPAPGRRLAHAGSYEAFVFQAIERGLQSARRGGPARAGFDLGQYGDAVSSLADTKNRERHDLFEFAE